MKIYGPGDVVAHVSLPAGERLEATDTRAIHQFLRGQVVQSGENVVAAIDGLMVCDERVLWFVPNDGLWGRLALAGNKLHRIVMRDVHSVMASLNPPETGEIKQVATAEQVEAYRHDQWPAP